jgi:hypothetical protein
MTTTLPALAIEIHELPFQKGLFLDAPVSGGDVGAGTPLFHHGWRRSLCFRTEEPVLPHGKKIIYQARQDQDSIQNVQPDPDRRTMICVSLLYGSGQDSSSHHAELDFRQAQPAGGIIWPAYASFGTGFC